MEESNLHKKRRASSPPEADHQTPKRICFKPERQSTPIKDEPDKDFDWSTLLCTPVKQEHQYKHQPSPEYSPESFRHDLSFSSPPAPDFYEKSTPQATPNFTPKIEYLPTPKITSQDFPEAKLIESPCAVVKTRKKAAPKARKVFVKLEISDDEEDLEEDEDVITADEEEEEEVYEKPLPRAPPPIFAHNRQSICDALPWFKAHQSGTYTHKLLVKGLYMDKWACVRDNLWDNILITHVGGGRSKDDSHNGHGRNNDQKPSNHHVSWKASIDRQQYVVAIIGKKLPACKVKVDHDFNVLGFFFVVDLWWEKDLDGFKFAKVKLQRLGTETPAWWAPADVPVEQDPKPGRFNAPQSKCEQCAVLSKQIYKEGWCCLNHECSEFFGFSSLVDVTNLTYSDVFLKERKKYLGTAVFSSKDESEYKKSPERITEILEKCPREQPPSLYPELPVPGKDGKGSEKNFRMGFVCPKCHCCSRRKFWSGWECENKNCDMVIDSPMQILPINEIGPVMSATRLGKLERIDPRVTTLIAETQVNGYMVRQFALRNMAGVLDMSCDAIVGTVTHFQATDTTRRAPNGPDELWEKVQECASSGRWARGAVRHAGLPSEVLTRNFVQNYGAPYKFVVSVTGKSFEETPNSILAALNRLSWMGRQAVRLSNESLEDKDIDKSANLSDKFVDFNEILAMGYFEDDRVSWHDDGEDQLGPTVATLSLGAPSHMSFKPKNPRIDGARPDKRLGGEVLRLGLQHGDVLVMHGTEIHQCFEHKVDPRGPRRIALTSRHVQMERVDERLREHACEFARLPERARVEEMQYDGF